MAGNIFLSEIYRLIFQARNVFCTMPGKIFFPNFFLGINPLPPPPHHFSNGPSLIVQISVHIQQMGPRNFIIGLSSLWCGIKDEIEGLFQDFYI